MGVGGRRREMEKKWGNPKNEGGALANLGNGKPKNQKMRKVRRERREKREERGEGDMGVWVRERESGWGSWGR